MNPVAIHAFNPGPMTGAGNTTWFLPGRVPVLIDAGTGDPRHLAALREALDAAVLRRVYVTHAHGDHASGAPALAREMPHLTFWKMPWPERDGKWPAPWQPLANGDEIEAGDTTLRVIHTPGHSPDHVSLWHEPTRALFCGDLAVKSTTVVIPASSGGDLGAYLASLERVLALRPERLLPAHGPVIEDPDKLLRNYIRHRQEREAQVLEALKSGDGSVEQIASRIYRGLSEALVPMARDSVLAHLLKLERDRRAARTAEGWHIIGP